MKVSVLFLITLTMMLLPAAGRCAYPSLAEAQVLFSSEMMNSRESPLKNSQYNDFVLRLREFAEPENVAAVEAVILKGVTSIVVNVSTNAIDDGTPTWILSSRGDMLADITPNLRDFSTNAVSCILLASYAGTVKKIAFPNDLVLKRFNVHLFCLSTNEVDKMRFQQSLQYRAELMARRDLQVRVQQANEAVDIYRRKLMSICSVGVAGCRKIMNDEQFAEFTNRVVNVSCANEEERAILFNRLAIE